MIYSNTLQDWTLTTTEWFTMRKKGKTRWLKWYASPPKMSADCRGDAREGEEFLAGRVGDTHCGTSRLSHWLRALRRVGIDAAEPATTPKCPASRLSDPRGGRRRCRFASTRSPPPPPAVTTDRPDGDEAGRGPSAGLGRYARARAVVPLPPRVKRAVSRYIRWFS